MIVAILLMGIIMLNACSGGCNCSKWQPEKPQEVKDEK